MFILKLFSGVLPLLLFPLFSRGKTDVYAGKTEMNGLTLQKFADFEKNWQLVTVRYRKDTGEMRLTYANELAWKTMQADSEKYPDGAVFAKIGMITEEDPAFTSSAVPSGARRYQFMVKDEKKYKETQGWGYALFDDQGKTFPGEPHAATLACAACHRVVPQRDYVFSQPMQLSPFAKKTFQRSTALDSVPFVTQTVASLPAKLSQEIPPNYKNVQVVSGSIVESIFSGTLDEIRPRLYKEVALKNQPAVLFDKKGDHFSLVYPKMDSKNCNENELTLISVISSPFKKKSSQIVCFQKDKK